jgi:hypothetical protein
MKSSRMLVAGLIGPAFVLGQTTAPEASPSASSPSATVFLDPFSVTSSAEVGYVPSNSLAGSRLGLPINETPYNITVLSRDLLDDLGVLDFNAALSLFSGVTSNEEDVIPSAYNDYLSSSRNMGSSAGTTTPTRNYFQIAFNFDNYNTDRIEFVRGPNSFLNNNNQFGAVNSATKEALRRPLTEVRALVSSYGGQRVTLDINRPLTSKWAARLNVLWDDQDGWRDLERTRKQGFHFATSYQLAKNTLLRGEFEYVVTERDVNYGQVDGYSRWDGVTTVAGPLTANPAGTTGLSRITNDEWVFFPGSTVLGVQNFRNYPATIGNGVQLYGADSYTEYADFSGPLARLTPGAAAFFGRPFALAPNRGNTAVQNTYAARNPLNYGAFFFTHKLAPRLSMEIAGAFLQQRREVLLPNNLFQDVRVDVVRTLPDGRPNPYFGELYAQGRAIDTVQQNRNYNGRVQFAYADGLPWLKYRLLAGTWYQQGTFTNRTQTYMVDTGTNIFTNNANDPYVVRPRLYLRDQGAHVPLPAEREIAPGVRVRRVFTGDMNPSHGSSYNHQFALTGSWLRSGRIKTVAALRFDERYLEDLVQYVATPTSRGELVERTVITNRGSNPNKYSTARNFGVTVEVIKNIHAFASYAENPPAGSPTQVDINGTELPVPLRRAIEGGLKGTFLGGSLGMTLNYFLNEMTDQSTNELSGGVDDFDTRLENISRLVGTPLSLPDTFLDVRTFEAKGVEFETTANFGRAASIRADISVSDTAVADEFPITRAYIDARRADWTARAQSLDPVSRQTVLDEIAGLDQRIGSRGPGRRLSNTYSYTASITGTYRRHDGALKGASASLTATLRGRRYVVPYPVGISLPGGAVATAMDFVEQDPYFTLRLNLGYSRKILGRMTRFQATIENLLDVDDPLYSGTAFSRVDADGRSSATGAYYVPNRFQYVPPRRLQVSTVVQF